MYVYIGFLASDLARLDTESQAVNPIAQWTIRTIACHATVYVTATVAWQALAQKVC